MSCGLGVRRVRVRIRAKVGFGVGVNVKSNQVKSSSGATHSRSEHPGSMRRARIA